jgi:plasmid stabilization system protein ParE
MDDQPYTLARWYVRAGQQEACVVAWRELAAFFLSLREPPRWGTLLRSVEDERLFSSFGPWPSMETIAAMRAHP